MTISERLSALRRQKSATQEELAQALGVTNQAVSKWETGVCCPDIQLLPALCAYYGVSADELLGIETARGYERVYREIRALFRETPAEDAYALAASLGGLLHEGCSTYGYRQKMQWDTETIRGLRDDWGFSMRSEPDGVTVRRGGAVFLSDSRREKPISATSVRAIREILARLADADTLRAFFALYDLTVANARYVPLEELSAQTRIPAASLKTVLDGLPIAEREDGGDGYRLSGMYMQIAPLIKLLTPNC